MLLILNMNTTTPEGLAPRPGITIGIYVLAADVPLDTELCRDTKFCRHGHGQKMTIVEMGASRLHDTAHAARPQKAKWISASCYSYKCLGSTIKINILPLLIHSTWHGTHSPLQEKWIAFVRENTSCNICSTDLIHTAAAMTLRWRTKPSFLPWTPVSSNGGNSCPWATNSIQSVWWPVKSQTWAGNSEAWHLRSYQRPA